MVPRIGLPARPVAILAALVALGSAAVAYAAGQQRQAPTVHQRTPTPTPPVLTVPDVTRQAFVFAKGTLEDSGFAWKVAGSVQAMPRTRSRGSSLRQARRSTTPAHRS